MTVDDETESRILQKAEYVAEAVAVLARKQSLELETYLDDREQRSIVEREFQTAIEACIDIAELLIVAGDVEMPETNAEKFTVLNELEILTDETAEQLRIAAGFRNVLAHNYGHDIDDIQVYDHLQSDLYWFPRYLREVREHLG